MANAEPNLPMIGISTYKIFVDEYESLIKFSTRKLERALRLLHRSHNLRNRVRRRRVYRVVSDLVHSWRSLVHGAQQIIGNGQYIDYQSLPSIDLVRGENPSDEKLAARQADMHDLEHTMREIFEHAKSRLIDDSEEGLYN